MVIFLGILVAYALVGIIAGTWAWLDQEFAGEGYWYHVWVFLWWGVVLFLMVRDWVDTDD